MPLSAAWLPISIVSFILAAVAGLIGTLSGVRAGEFAFDQSLNAANNPVLDAIAVGASEIYSPKWAVVITLVIMVAILIRTRSRVDTLAFGGIVAAGWLPAEPFKIFFNEPRPNQSQLAHMLVQREVDAAFPSGHLCFALAIGYGLFLLSRHTKASKAVLVLWLISITIMGWARLYVGVHYVNDLVGSVFSTILGITIFAYIWNNWIYSALSKTKFFSR